MRAGSPKQILRSLIRLTRSPDPIHIELVSVERGEYVARARLKTWEREGETNERDKLALISLIPLTAMTK